MLQFFFAGILLYFVDILICVYLSGLFRNIQFFGLESQQKVTASYVVVIGLGGVGSHAASMLLRSGVGRLLLVDFDQVSVSFCVFLACTLSIKKKILNTVTHILLYKSS